MVTPRLMVIMAVLATLPSGSIRVTPNDGENITMDGENNTKNSVNTAIDGKGAPKGLVIGRWFGWVEKEM